MQTSQFSLFLSLFSSKSWCNEEDFETRSCDVACPIDCQLSSWSSWTNCNSTCGPGSQQRHRKVSTSTYWIYPLAVIFFLLYIPLFCRAWHACITGSNWPIPRFSDRTSTLAEFKHWASMMLQLSGQHGRSQGDSSLRSLVISRVCVYY